MCSANGVNTTYNVESSYPYDEVKLTLRVTSGVNGTQTIRGKPDNDHSAAAEFFVAWGVLSMIYCLVAILVYMLFSASEEMVKINNILIIIVSVCVLLTCSETFVTGLWVNHILGCDVVYCISCLGCRVEQPE